LQQTLHHNEKADGFDKYWRKLPLDERIAIGERLKADGTALHKQLKRKPAADKYSQVAGLFHWVERLPGKGNHGCEVEDTTLRVVTDEGNEQEDKVLFDKARALRLSCYTNIALTLLQDAEPKYKSICGACDLALSIDPSNVKALYRRGVAYEGLSQHGADYFENLEAAAKDLAKAVQLAPEDTAVQLAEQRVRREVKAHKKAWKQDFGNFFERGEIGGSDERARELLREQEAELAAEADGAKEENTILRSGKLREAYLRAGMLDDARIMEETIEFCKDRICERGDRSFDVLKPSDEMKEKAKEFGIDLDKPEERRKLDKLLWQVNSVEDESCEGDGKDESKNLASWLYETFLVLIVLVVVFYLFIGVMAW